MKDLGPGKGTSFYIVGEISRFDQKNEMFKRSMWDPQFEQERKIYYGPSYPKEKDGFSQEDLALFVASWYLEWGFGFGTAIHNKGLFSWDPPQSAVRRLPPDIKRKVADPYWMSRQVKRVAKYFGASEVGISMTDRRWVYSHSYNIETGEHREFELPEECKYSISVALEMDYRLAKTSPTWLARAAEGKAYSMLPVVTSMLAQFIRGLGYRAIPSGNDSALSIPLAIDAGLGELGRNGCLITPRHGPRVRLGQVFTDLPLACDGPIRFGVIEFCEICRKCAKHCPGHAIMQGERTTQAHNICNSTGVLKWPINAEKCFSFWAQNRGSCMNCIRVCPFNKVAGWQHEVVRWLIHHVPTLDRLILMGDELLGYGKKARAAGYWD
jgi:epoxyqueuosine reductase